MHHGESQAVHSLSVADMFVTDAIHWRAVMMILWLSR